MIMFGKSRKIKELEARLNDAELLLVSIKSSIELYQEPDNKRKKNAFCKVVLNSINNYKLKYESYGK